MTDETPDTQDRPASTQPPEVAKVLPFEARALLVRAASTPIPDCDPYARIRAIEEATARVQRALPEFFK